MRALALTVSVTTAAVLVAMPLRAPQAVRQAGTEKQSHGARHSNRAEKDRIPPERAADSYAIYSLLMPGKLFEHSSQSSSRWAIAQKTITFEEMSPRIDPRGALKPPSGDEKAFHQAVHNFEISRALSYTLQPRLHLGRPYDLLDPAQVRDLRHAKSGLDPGSRMQSHYKEYPGVTFFSAVYFSNDQKAALVYVNDWCGVLCSQGQWVYLEKKNGRWKRMSGIVVPGA